MKPKIWLLYLVLPGRYGHIATGLLIFTLMATAFLLAGDLRSLISSGALFFCAIPAYIVPVFSYINRISVQAVDDLEAIVTVPAQEFQQLRHSLSHQSSLWGLLVAGIGLAGGISHLSLIHISMGGIAQHPLNDPAELLGDVGALIVWVTMTVVISSLMKNAVRIGRLGNSLQPVNLLRMDKLLPFALVAISSCLSLTGTLALFPLLFIDQSLALMPVLPGMVATAIPMLAMLLLPMWRAHYAIKARKLDELAQVNHRLDELSPGTGLLLEQAGLEQVNNLLEYRKHLQHMPDWPIDIGAISRLALYLIIPPLGWVGAALIENLVNAML